MQIEIPFQSCFPTYLEFDFFLTQKSFPKLDFLLIPQATKRKREREDTMPSVWIFLLNVTGRDPIFLTKWIGKVLNNSASIYSLGVCCV